MRVDLDVTHTYPYSFIRRHSYVILHMRIDLEKAEAALLLLVAAALAVAARLALLLAALAAALALLLAVAAGNTVGLGHLY